MGTEKDGTSLDDIEREVDRMEQAEAGGDAVSPIVGASDDDIEVILATEGEDDEVVVDRPGEREQPAADADTESAEATASDDDLAPYSEKVRKRIMRERNLRQDAETREEAERSARISTQAELHNTQLNSAEITLAMVEGQIKDKESSLKVAKDAGKVEDDIRITGELGELRARKTEVERVRDHLKTAKPVQPNPLVHAWQKNHRWFDNPEFSVESAAVRAISNQILQKFPANTQAHFDEVDRQLRARMPNLAARVKARLGQDAIRWSDDSRPAERQGGEQQRRQAPRLASPGAGFGKPAANGKRQITLTRGDMEAMRNVRLDPNNKAHVLEYAREKNALINR